MHMTLGSWHISVERTRPSSAELASMYDHAARRWQPSIHKLGYDWAYDRLFVQLQADGILRGLARSGRVLDTGIGTGALSLALARTVAVPLGIDGIDISREMLKEARRALRAAGIPARMQQRDAYDLPFVRDRFDLVMSAHLLEHLDDPHRALAEMTRVLRPGAPLLVVVTRPGFFDELLQLKWRYSSIEPVQLADMLQAVGLTDVRHYDLAANHWLVHLSSVALVGFRKDTP